MRFSSLIYLVEDSTMNSRIMSNKVRASISRAYPNFGILKIVIPAELGRTGDWVVRLAMVWPQVLCHV